MELRLKRIPTKISNQPHFTTLFLLILCPIWLSDSIYVGELPFFQYICLISHYAAWLEIIVSCSLRFAGFIHGKGDVVGENRAGTFADQFTQSHSVDLRIKGPLIAINPTWNQTPKDQSIPDAHYVNSILQVTAIEEELVSFVIRPSAPLRITLVPSVSTQSLIPLAFSVRT